MMTSSLRALKFAGVCLLASSLLIGSPQDAQAKKRAVGIDFANKGQVTLAGSAHFSSPSITGVADGDEGDSVDGPTNFGLSFRGGYFVFSNETMGLELGGKLSFERSDMEQANVTTKSSTFMVALDPALYFKALKKNGLFPFVHLSLGYGTQGSEQEASGVNISTENTLTQIAPGVGVTFNIGRGRGPKSRGAMIRTELNYEMTSNLDKDDNGEKASGLALGLSFGAFF